MLGYRVRVRLGVVTSLLCVWKGMCVKVCVSDMTDNTHGLSFTTQWLGYKVRVRLRVVRVYSPIFSAPLNPPKPQYKGIIHKDNTSFPMAQIEPKGGAAAPAQDERGFSEHVNRLNAGVNGPSTTTQKEYEDILRFLEPDSSDKSPEVIRTNTLNSLKGVPINTLVVNPDTFTGVENYGDVSDYFFTHPISEMPDVKQLCSDVSGNLKTARLLGGANFSFDVGINEDDMVYFDPRVDDIFGIWPKEFIDSIAGSGNAIGQLIEDRYGAIPGKDYNRVKVSVQRVRGSTHWHGDNPKDKYLALFYTDHHNDGMGKIPPTLISPLPKNMWGNPEKREPNWEQLKTKYEFDLAEQLPCTNLFILHNDRVLHAAPDTPAIRGTVLVRFSFSKENDTVVESGLLRDDVSEESIMPNKEMRTTTGVPRYEKDLLRIHSFLGSSKPEDFDALHFHVGFHISNNPMNVADQIISPHLQLLRHSSLSKGESVIDVLEFLDDIIQDDIIQEQGRYRALANTPVLHLSLTKMVTSWFNAHACTSTEYPRPLKFMKDNYGKGDTKYADWTDERIRGISDFVKANQGFVQERLDNLIDTMLRPPTSRQRMKDRFAIILTDLAKLKTVSPSSSGEQSINVVVPSRISRDTQSLLTEEEIMELTIQNATSVTICSTLKSDVCTEIVSPSFNVVASFNMTDPELDRHVKNAIASATIPSDDIVSSNLTEYSKDYDVLNFKGPRLG